MSGKTRTVALYGGSFNPPHVGHAMVASWVLWTGLADEVWWTPSFSHPFAKDLTPFDTRTALLETLCAALGPGHRCCAIERELPTPSYTVDVLDALGGRHPETAFRVVMGADNLPTLHKWKDASRLQATYAPIVVGRDGYDNPPGAVVFPGVSSTQVRAVASAGESVRAFVHSAIAERVEAVYSSASIAGGPKPSQP